MSEMETSDAEADQKKDLELLDRVFLRLGNADTDTQLENCITRFLPPVILKLSSPHENVRTKVMELLVHVNRRVKCSSLVQLPVETLLTNYINPASNSFITNFSILYITMGFPRLSREKQIELAPLMLEAIENKPQVHQDGILFLLMLLLGDLNVDNLKLKEKPKLLKIVLRYATDVLLLPYRALPSESVEKQDFQVPPGMSMKSYKRIVEKNSIKADQLEQMKLSIVKFISKDGFSGKDILLPLIVAAADSRFSIANEANSPLIRVSSSVDWSLPATTAPLYGLYLGSPTGSDIDIPTEHRKTDACIRLRLKLIQYLNKATGAGILFPQSVQVVFFSLFSTNNTNSRLKNCVLSFMLNVIQNGDTDQMNSVAQVFLHGCSKVIRDDQLAEHHPKALMCLGKLVATRPKCLNNQIALLEELVKKLPDAPPEMKMALRDAILEMANGYKIHTDTVNEDTTGTTPMDTSGPSTSKGEPMDVSPTETKRAKSSPLDEPESLALFAILDQYMHSDDGMIRYIAMRYAAVVFPVDYIPSRYLLLLACGDSQDEVSKEAKKYLYGASRTSEIDDIVNNVGGKETNAVNLDHGGSSKQNAEGAVIKVPKFDDVVNYIWEQLEKRKRGSNSKQRFVVNNVVLQFHPKTYSEILRYLRMCLNHDAGLKDCSNHPNASSPILAKYITDNLLQVDTLTKYLALVKNILNTPVSDVMPLTCFLDILGCVPHIVAPEYVKMMDFFKNVFVTNNNEDIRETAAKIYAIIRVTTSEQKDIEREINDFISESQSGKRLETQCGYISAFSNICERCIAAYYNKKTDCGKSFTLENWAPFKAAVLVLVNHLTSNQNLLLNAAVTNIGLLGRRTSLPLPDMLPAHEVLFEETHAMGVGKKELTLIEGPEVTKIDVFHRLFKIIEDSKLPVKLKEKAIYTVGLLNCGGSIPFAKHVMGGLVLLSKETKDIEIHLQIGEALVICVDGVNSDENRDFWTELPTNSKDSVKDPKALSANDELMTWLLQSLITLAKTPHPHSRQACSVWLLALLKNCGYRQPIQGQLQTIQDIFMDFLSENSEIVQDVASKGLSLVYQNSSQSQQKELVAQIIDQLTSGKRSVNQVTSDTKIFEDGQLGKAPFGGNLTTYKELCSLASDLNQPDLLYKFMHLANHNSMWNSKKGAAFGFHSIALKAGEQLTEHLPKIVPRLYRYRFDPTPRIQNSMSSIWHAIVPETQKTVHKYHKEILEDLVMNLTSNQWRVRISCCNALTDLLRGARSLHDSLDHLPTLWKQLFRVMDDVHEGTRNAAISTANVLSKLCVQASDSNHANSGKAIVSAILPVLLDEGITNLVADVRNISLQTVSKLVTAAGEGLKEMLPKLIPAMVTAAGDLESAKLSYLSTALGTDSSTREVLDDLRAHAARQHYTIDTVVKCMPFLTIEVLTEMLPKMLELMKSPQLGTKVACCHFFILSSQHLRHELEPVAGKLMANLINGAFDRNVTVRKNCAEALGQVSAYAKSSSVEKLMKKLVTLNESKDDELTRSAIGFTLKSVSKAKIELIKDNEELIAPMVYFAIHAPKDEEKATVEMYEEIWADISPGRETGLRAYLAPICRFIEDALASRSWTKKTQAAFALKDLTEKSVFGVGTERHNLIRSVLAALQGKIYDGKQHLLDALAQLTLVKPPENPLPEVFAEEAMNALMAECHKQDLVYKKHALDALGVVLNNYDFDRFQQVYEIVKVVLSKDESSIKDADEEETDATRERRDQLQKLKDSAYVLLGRAFPKNRDTQEKYQEQFFTHCSTSYRVSSRTTQTSILSALRDVIRMIFLMNKKPEPPIEELKAVCKKDLIEKMTNHVTDIIEYTLVNINQSRHKKEVIGLMTILIQKLKALSYLESMSKLQAISNEHVADLSKDSSYEVRMAVDELKRCLQ